MRAGLVVLAVILTVGLIVGLGNFFSPPPSVQSSGKNPLFNEANQWWESNPFVADKTMTPEAKAVTPDDTFEFNTMELGTTQAHGFVIRNDGTVPLKLAKGRTQCKCTLAGLKSDTLAPGEETIIELEWEPKSLGEFFQQAIIYTSDPKQPEIKFGAKGLMCSRVGFSPEQGWTLGIIGTEPLPLEGYVYSQVLDSLEIKEVKASADYIHLELLPIPPDQAPYPHCKVAYQIKGELRSPGKVGKLRDEVSIVTGDEITGTLKFPISGERLGAFTVQGPGWFAQKSLFNLAKIDSTKGKVVRYALLVDASLGEIEFSEIKTKPEFIQVKILPGETVATKKKYMIELVIPPGSPAGSWPAENPGQVSFRGSHPEVAELVFNVWMQIK